MACKDYYGILGVPKDASRDEIRRAYRSLVRKHHPDRNEGDLASEEKLKEINEAYGVLGDPEKKKAYDALRKVSPPRSEAPFRGFGDDPTRPPFETPHPWDRLWSWILEDSFENGAFFVDPFRSPWSKPRERTLVSMKRSAGRKGPSLEVHIDVPASRLAQGEARWVAYRVEGRVEEVLVRIPPNVSDGFRLRMAGRGAPSSFGGPPGDLYVVVHVVSDA